MEVYGYARVSTREQKEDRQMIALTEHSVDEKNIFGTSSLERILTGHIIEKC